MAVMMTKAGFMIEEGEKQLEVRKETITLNLVWFKRFSAPSG